MKTIEVKASGCYHILIGKGLFESLGAQIQNTFPACKKILLLSDEKVFSLYGEQILEQLSPRFSLCTFLVPAGEESKSLVNYAAILETMANEKLTRSDLLVALGGGVVGDLGGFAAASYLRGIDFVQLPTTLLAAVDSSVGGKTAVNLSAGKNLAGAFHQPGLVVVDINCLESLEHQVLRDGCAEVIKYAVLKDASLFEALRGGKEFAKSEECIARCVSIKKEYVQADEFDKGERQFLNLGHTIGHAIEKKSGYGVSHGQAVAMGMAMISKCAFANGMISKEVLDEILELLDRFGFETKAPYPLCDLFPLMLSDKKRAGDRVTLVLPLHIGECTLHSAGVEELEEWMRKGWTL